MRKERDVVANRKSGREREVNRGTGRERGEESEVVTNRESGRKGR